MSSAIAQRVILVVLGVSLIGMGCKPPAAQPDDATNASSDKLPSTEEALARIYALGGKTNPESPKPSDVVTRVYLANTAATDADLAVLLAFERLSSVDLSGTQVTGEGLATLAKIESLERIVLKDLDIPVAYLADLRSLPRLRHSKPLTQEELSLWRTHPVPPFDQRLVELWLIPDSELTMGEWAMSDDGAVSLRLMAPNKPVAGKEPMVILAELRNNTGEPITVISPFGDRHTAMRVMQISGPNGPLEYTGPYFKYSMGKNFRTSIPPGRAVRGSIELSVASYGGSDKPGQYTIVYPYIFGSHHANTPWGTALWQGEIRSEAITVTRQE